MMTLPFQGLSPEVIRVMRDVLAGTHHEPSHELSGALRMHEGVLRWWQGVGAALSRGVEGSQARALLSFQITFCEVDAIFLQIALDNAADVPSPEDGDKARAALAAAREIEAKAREWLDFVSHPSKTPTEEQLTRGLAAYMRGETLDLKYAAAQLRVRRP